MFIWKVSVENRDPVVRTYSALSGGAGVEMSEAVIVASVVGLAVGLQSQPHGRIDSRGVAIDDSSDFSRVQIQYPPPPVTASHCLSFLLHAVDAD